MSLQLISEAVEAIRKVRPGGDIGPGNAFRINEAAGIGDGVWQGDLGIEVVEAIPEHYVASKPKKQLVPGDTRGARHCIKNVTTIKQFSLPPDWGDDYIGLEGPAFVCVKETTIPHPIHADVHIAPGHTIRLRYQRNLDEETKRERRAID